MLNANQAAQLDVLEIVAEHDEQMTECSSTTVADDLMITPNAAALRLMRYTRRHWMTRERGSDGFRYTLTNAGRQRLEWLLRRART